MGSIIVLLFLIPFIIILFTIARIRQDILEEDTDTIKDMLFKMFKDDVLRASINGFPEYYKNKLVENIS